MKYFPEYDCSKRIMKIVGVDDSQVKSHYISKTMKYLINNTYYVEEIYDSVESAVDSLGLYFSPVLLPNGEIYHS